MSDHRRFRERSASYVVGALSGAERAEYESHLEHCDECKRDIETFAPVLGLLRRLEQDETARMPEDAVLSAIDRARSEWSDMDKSRRRWRLATAVAAVITVVAILGRGIDAPGDTGVALALEPSTVTGEILVEEKAWGTAVEIRLSDLPALDRYVAWAVSSDGRWEQLAAWGPTPTGRALVSGATSIATVELETVAITSEDRTETIVVGHADT